MTFEEVKHIIKQLNVVNVKITDTNGKKVMQFFDELSPENLIAKLDGFAPTLQTYGRLTFIGATAAQFKQNWKDCYQWPVVFSTIPAHLTSTNEPQKINQGYVSHNEATLMAQLAGLQMQMDFNKKIADLEKKIDGGKEKESQWERVIDKYFPMVAPQFGITMSPEQMDSAMKYYQMQAMMNGKMMPPVQNNGMAGLNIQTNTNPSIQQTEEEKQTEDEIVKELTALSEKTSDQKLLTLIKALNNNPAYVDMAINFMNTTKK